MLPLIFLVLMAAQVRAGERLVPVEMERIPEGCAVLLRVGPDSIPIGYADSGRVLLTKRKDSAHIMPHGRLLVISELAIRRARELLPVKGETWNGRKQGTATVTFAIRDGLGNPDSIRARIETADIEQVFLRIPIPEPKARMDAREKGITVAAGALVCGVLGFAYVKANHVYQDGSSPGSAEFFAILTGTIIGLGYGFQFAFLDD